jgi:peptidylamidoglycolate lyase
MLNKYRRLIFVTLIFSCCCSAGMPQALQTLRNPPKYELVNDWPQLPEGYILSQPGGIGIDTSQNVFVFHRPGRRWKLLEEEFPDSLISANTILMLDRQTGKILNSWGGNVFIMPHGLTVDKDNNVWVTDVGLHQVFKFSHEGKLLMRLGEAKIPGNDSLHFNRPTDIAVAADGSFYVSDGYRNSRIVKFSRSGRYLFEWGKKGSKPGEFNIPHAIDLDAKGNVYVADRQNNRIQEFDANGKFLKEWKNRSFANLYSVTINKINQHLLAVDYLIIMDTIIKGSNIIEFNSEGNLIGQFGRSGSYNGPLCRYHDICVDNEGNIYVGDILGNRVQKFRLISY